MAETKITGDMLDILRKAVVDAASYARYRIGDTWYRAEFESKAVQWNGAVHVSFYMHRQNGSNMSASEFQIMGSNGQTLAQRTENISFADNVQTMLYRFKFVLSA